jgi:cytochrome c oxidase assembly factor CtaG
MPDLSPVPLAHGAAADAGERWWQIAAVLSLAALGAGYGRGVQELWSRGGAGAAVPRARVLAFAVGLVAVVLAQAPPVHHVAEESFAGHMAQHMLLLVVAGPLLAAGGAGLPLAVALPPAGRRRVARLRSSRPGRWLRRPAHRAVAVAGLHTAVLWVWHFPAPYLAALRHPAVHVAEHASFLAAAWLLWAAVVGPRRQRLAGPVAFLLLFATGMAAAALGAVLTLARAPLYPPSAYPAAGAPSGDPLADQQLAGLVMWVPMDALVLAAAAGAFLRWLTGLERRLPAARDLPAAREVGVR